MADNTNVNNNAAVVVVGRTAPVPPGQQDAANSLPVVIATDQQSIPVEEQNKQQSEVALSLLGIPRSEVALGIFADVNTYDVNPSEWSAFPEQFSTIENTGIYSGIGGNMDWGLTHIAEEAGALIEGPADNYSILTSKRFFRYQPGRVSAATFGVKVTQAPYTIQNGAVVGDAVRNPSIKKYGIFDKFDGYYWESRNDGLGDNFVVVRRTQSITRINPQPFGTNTGQQVEDYADTGIGLTDDQGNQYLNTYEIIKANKWYLMNLAAETTDAEDKEKCARDVAYVIEGYLDDLRYGGNANTVYNAQRYYNQTTGDLFVDAGTEIARHTTIRTAINTLLDGGSVAATTSYVDGVTSIAGFTAGSSGLPLANSLEEGTDSRISELTGIIIDGLGNKSTIPSDPTGATYGEMCILRDGLLLTHAASTDPSLLNERVDYKIVGTNPTDDEVLVIVPEGKPNIEFGQNFSYNRNESATEAVVSVTGGDNLDDGRIYYAKRVRVERSQVGADWFTYNYIQLSETPTNEETYTEVGGGNPTNPWTAGNAYPGNLIQLTTAPATFRSPQESDGQSLSTPTAFLLPNDTRKYTGSNYSDKSFNKDLDEGYVDGCFPYMYPPASDNISETIGYIDTAIDGSTASYATLKSRINYVNKRLYKKWCQFNVNPKFYKVYEYRVPRSRFSGEKVNGTLTDTLYSDNVLDFTAGQTVTDPTTGEVIQATSIWDLDPTKVTMYKIEFSWYGAVGATFLAYVPVSNDEARWVRVHHLRASNQLKVASLGNATLPITYLAYGGGSEIKEGYVNTSRYEKDLSGSGSFSEYLTKYGASYYIDGGDRGTVRLFSYAGEDQKTIYGSKYRISGADCSSAQTTQDAVIGATYVNAPFISLSNATLNGAPTLSDYYLGAKVLTGNSNDQNITVVWIDSSNQKLYVNKPLVQSSTNTPIDIVVDRVKPLLGLKCREEINSVRNRVQVYPTRLATGASGVLNLQLLRSPKFQTFDAYSGVLSIAGGTNSFVNVGRRGKKTALTGETSESAGAGNFIQDGSSVYGYFRYTLAGDSSGNAYTMLGLVEKEGGIVYFTADRKTVSDVLIRGSFVPAGNYNGPDPSAFSVPTEPYQTSTLNDLSAVITDPEQRSPIPGTGQVVTTIFTSNAGSEFDLSPYFDYNKDYLSFPLTNQVESLYVCASSKAFYRNTSDLNTDVPRGDVLASITWEEQ